MTCFPLSQDARDRQFTPVEPAVHYDNDEPLEMKGTRTTERRVLVADWSTDLNAQL